MTFYGLCSNLNKLRTFSPSGGELEGEWFCIAPHPLRTWILVILLQSCKLSTCVAPSPFGEEHWKTKSIKRPFVLDYCFTLRSRSFHLLTQINIHFASRYFGVPSLRSVSLRKIRFVQFGFLNFRPFCHPEFFTLYLLACSYFSKLKAFTPQGLTRM